jgi:hypothetical protein
VSRILVLSLVGLLLAVPLAHAHVTRTIGASSIKVGWEREPPATQERNAVVIQVWKTATGEGIGGLADKLAVKITLATQSKTLTMAESDEEPGNYSAPVVLTEAGIYKIHVEGSIQGVQLSQDFQLDDVKDINDDSFPPQGTGATNKELQLQVEKLRVDLDKLQQQQSNRVPGLDVPLALLAVVACGLILGRARRAP